MNIYTLHDTLQAPALCNTCGVTKYIYCVVVSTSNQGNIKIRFN